MEQAMDIDKARHFLSALDKRGISHMVIGGFAFEAKRGKVTRAHEDLDVICKKEDEDKVMKLVKEEGFVISNKLNNRYKIGKKDGSKIDLYLAEADGDKRVTHGKRMSLSFPKDLLGFQAAKLLDLDLKLAPNEILKKTGFESRFDEDIAIAEKLLVNDKKFGHVKKLMM
jgi:hypothetical protein